MKIEIVGETANSLGFFQIAFEGQIAVKKQTIGDNLKELLYFKSTYLT